MMDLTSHIASVKNNPSIKLASDNNFKNVTRKPAIFAAAYVSQLVAKKSFNLEHERDFVIKHTEAWAELTSNLSNWEKSSASIELPRNDRILIVAWHFPELPTLFNYVRKIHALALVSQDAEWMGNLKAERCTLNILNPSSVEILFNEMQKGRIIGCILDHYHPEMKSVETAFLGRKIRIASNIFELCIKHDYLIAFVAPRAEGIQIINQIDSKGKTPQELAQTYATWLESEIKATPEKWLMWQGLPSITSEVSPQVLQKYKRTMVSPPGSKKPETKGG
jgi:Bacterial lipid A biosynthesis acyltransferase